MKAIQSFDHGNGIQTEFFHGNELRRIGKPGIKQNIICMMTGRLSLLQQLDHDIRSLHLCQLSAFCSKRTTIVLDYRSNEVALLGGGQQIISRETIEQSIDGGEAYRIMQDGNAAGGVILSVDGERGELEILFVSPAVHSRGIGYAAWQEVEKLHPEVKVWETVTPYFEQRNIHFYVNRCGFHIVEFFNSHHPDPNDPDMDERTEEQFPDGMFRFEKRMD